MTIDLKNNKGFTAVDAGIAMVIAVIFATVMTSLFYNVFISTQEAKKTATALNYAVDIFENIGSKNFEEVIPSYELFDINSLSGIQNGNINNEEGLGTVTATLGTYEIIVEINKNKNCYIKNNVSSF